MNVAHTTDKHTAPRDQEEARARTEDAPPDEAHAHDHTHQQEERGSRKQTHRQTRQHAHMRAHARTQTTLTRRVRRRFVTPPTREGLSQVCDAYAELLGPKAQGWRME